MSTSLTREIPAVRIPSGEAVMLTEGTEVAVTQALGGSYTLAAMDFGGLFRVDSEYADAFGEKPLEAPEKVAGDGSVEEQIWGQLRECYDPEIPVNIVDLGLIYTLELVDGDAGKVARVEMTLTAPGCGMGPSLAADAERRILTIAGVDDAKVELVWDPPWSPERISPAGRAALGID